jgi:hypothetical protein
MTKNSQRLMLFDFDKKKAEELIRRSSGRGMRSLCAAPEWINCLAGVNVWIDSQVRTAIHYLRWGDNY